MDMKDRNLETFGSYRAWLAKKGTWFINFMGGRQNIYLLEGNERALLIDTGYGTGTLRHFVESLTDKPVIAANTHFHRDHAGGNGEFEEVFMSKGALIDAEEWIHDRLPFDLSSLPHSGYRKRFLSDGDTIDLGGRVIEVLEAKPAHCCSSLFFLDRTGGNLFSGDELEAGQVLMYINHMKEGNTLPIRERISNMRSNTKRLLDISDEFEWLLPCHNGFPIDKSYIDDFIGLTENILAGKATTEKKLNHPVIEQLPVARLLSRVSYKKASIFMRDTDLHDLSLI